MLINPSRSRGHADDALPHADTCFFNVEIPAYSSDAVMKSRLLTAISADWGMGGDQQQTSRPPLDFAAMLQRVAPAAASAASAAPTRADTPVPLNVDLDSPAMDLDYLPLLDRGRLDDPLSPRSRLQQLMRDLRD